MSRYHDTHHYHRACGHTCSSATCDPTAHTVKCAKCRQQPLTTSDCAAQNAAHGRFAE